MSNTDLQQVNGTPAFPATADVGTAADTYLVPTDGKYVTAQSNNALEAPVFPAFVRTKDLLLGIRGAIFGDFAGSVRRTLKSLEVDGTGGVVSALAGGVIKAVNMLAQTYTANAGGTNTSIIGPAGMDVGNTAGGTFNVRENYVRWLNTVAGVSNPALTASIKNFLYPLQVLKAWGTISTDGAGNATMLDGAGVSTTITIAANKLTITLVDTMDNVTYGIVGQQRGDGVAEPMDIDPADKTTTTFKMKFAANPATKICTASFVIFGRQTT